MKVGIERIFANSKSSFISHMVQMKVYEFVESTKQKIIFISHMVQMKVLMLMITNWKACSLYPTWFRWKLPVPLVAIAYAPCLYIPHGSDESNLWNFRIYNQMLLYIPHGSDERVAWHAKVAAMQNFISHMVQMKAKTQKSGSKSCVTLYPTWFRWKSFYFYALCWWGSSLYIPHGSDERV